MSRSQSPATTEVVIYVEDRCGAYVTNTVHGRRASCTHSAEAAARRLADKLFLPAGGLRSGDNSGSAYEITDTSEGTQFVRRFSARGVLQVPAKTTPQRREQA